MTVASPTQLVLHLNGSVNSYWFTYNELSQIYPHTDGLGRGLLDASQGS